MDNLPSKHITTINIPMYIFFILCWSFKYEDHIYPVQLKEVVASITKSYTRLTVLKLAQHPNTLGIYADLYYFKQSTLVLYTVIV